MAKMPDGIFSHSKDTFGILYHRRGKYEENTDYQ